MKRDMELIRKILCYVEKNATCTMPVRLPSFDSHSAEAVEYHVKLCEQAGYLELHHPELMDEELGILCLTWDGHERLTAFSAK